MFYFISQGIITIVPHWILHFLLLLYFNSINNRERFMPEIFSHSTLPTLEYNNKYFFLFLALGTKAWHCISHWK